MIVLEFSGKIGSFSIAESRWYALNIFQIDCQPNSYQIKHNASKYISDTMNMDEINEVNEYKPTQG